MEPSISTPERSWPTGLKSAKHPSRMRFSLRALLVAVTMCALGVAAVVRASHVTLGVVSVATLVAFLVALSTAIYWVGPRRAFAAGFLAWGVPYAVLALWALPGEADESSCKLITSQFLHSFYPHVQHQTGTQPLYGGFPGGFGGGGGGFGGFGGGGFAGTPAAPATTSGDATAQAPAATSGSTSSGGTAPAPATTGQDAAAQTSATPSGSTSNGAPSPAPARTWPMVPPGTPTTVPLFEPSLGRLDFAGSHVVGVDVCDLRGICDAGDLAAEEPLILRFHRPGDWGDDDRGLRGCRGY
jgi:hypothetical protein